VRLINANQNVIDSNVINDNDPPGGGVAGGGLLLSGNSDDNTITFNEFSRNGNFAVAVAADDANRNVIRGNIVKDTRGTGILVRDNNNTIQENTLSGNGGDGISLISASGNFVQGNTALGNLPFDLSDTDCNNNTWTGNIFLSDNEVGSGAGPGAGCIQ
jgi:parallel beta-helix repeat protein